ncbi:MAG: ACP S-malonyltransferase [Waddliaceae bacterium]|nr:ACP S-malonyltransferase [Waddliaceae bacterium]MBT3579122.1 ACP S-malonyltransferase [Waddliaceae bacterium]MBT4444915.1 ACP S-malonyltransferase [Waddliaceae bacterium]MBT6927932.1 ACP S-malonyltransferase [Waddliaceae bacterium]MBT7462089.1 ACP S-malonyltransferase [Waddliaceae bacterium]
MKKNIIFIFPGQGAQYVGMGKDFAENFSIARETLEESDDILGTKLSKIIFEGPEDTLTATKNSQPAMLVNSIALLRTIKEQIPSLLPYICSGLSLGEYSALVAAEKVTFHEALNLVRYRGQYMHEACEKTKGSMAAILGLYSEDVEKIVSDLNIPEDLWVANYNTPKQIVISGTEKGIDIASAEAKRRGAKKVVPLNIHGAFHSGLMKEAQDKLASKIEDTQFSTSEIKVVMNVTGDFVENIDDIRENLIKQVTNSVRWQQGIQAIDATKPDLYVEIGCGKTLTAMNKRIGVSAPTVNVDKIEDLEKLAKALEE